MVERWVIWIVGGIVLVLLEIFVPSFFLAFLGAAAILTGLLDIFFQLSLAGELILFSILALMGTIAWSIFVRPRLRSSAGTAREEYLGVRGVAVTDINPNGRVMFDVPVIGSRLWEAVSTEPIPVGTPVMLVGIEGNRMQVKVYDPQEVELLQEQHLHTVPAAIAPLHHRLRELVKEFVAEVMRR